MWPPHSLCKMCFNNWGVYAHTLNVGWYSQGKFCIVKAPKIQLQRRIVRRVNWRTWFELQHNLLRLQWTFFTITTDCDGAVTQDRARLLSGRCCSEVILCMDELLSFQKQCHSLWELYCFREKFNHPTHIRVAFKGASFNHCKGSSFALLKKNQFRWKLRYWILSFDSWRSLTTAVSLSLFFIES